MSSTNDVIIVVEKSVIFEGIELTIHTILTRARDADVFLGTIMYIGHCELKIRKKQLDRLREI